MLQRIDKYFILLAEWIRKASSCQCFKTNEVYVREWLWRDEAHCCRVVVRESKEEVMEGKWCQKRLSHHVPIPLELALFHCVTKH